MEAVVHNVTKPGVVHDMPEADYHADPVQDGSLSHSWARELLKPGGPARFKWNRTHDPEPKDHFDFGKAAHAEVLGVGAEWVMSAYPDFRTKESQAWKAEMKSLGLTVISQKDAVTIRAMAAELGANGLAVSLLEGCREVSMFAEHETGVWLRGRADAGSDRGFADYKTTAKLADDVGFRRSVEDYGYYSQAPWYLDLNSRLGEPFAPRFRFVVQEKEAPYLVGVYELDAEFLDIGAARNRRAIDLYRECREADQWPGLAEEIVTLSPSRWLADQHYSQLDPDIETALMNMNLGDVA